MTAPPEWFLNLCQKRLTHSATRVGLALFTSGTRAVSTAGNPIIRGQLSLTQLEKLTCLSRPSITSGLEELEDLAGLTRHPSLLPMAAWGYALPLEKTPPGKLSLPLEREAVASLEAKALPGKLSLPPHGGGGVGRGGNSNNVPHPTPPPPLVKKLNQEEERKLLEDLADLGVADPQVFLRRFPAERIQAWIDWVHRQPEGRMKNPPGLIYTKLELGKDPPAEMDLTRRLARSKYGHLVRH